MPHPSAANAYPSYPGFYPSAPDPPATWVVSADGTVTSDVLGGYAPFGTAPFATAPFGGSVGPTSALLLTGAATGTGASDGSAVADYIGVVVAIGEVASSAGTLVVTHYSTAEGEVASGGTASATISATAEGVVTSAAIAPAAQYGDPFAWDTSSGTATANRTFADVAARTTVASSGSALATLILRAVATGTVRSIPLVRGPTLLAAAIASGVVRSQGTADGVRVQPASASGAVAAAGAADTQVGQVAAAAAAVTSSATAVDTARMWVSATVELGSHGDTDTARSALVTIASGGTALAARGQPAAAAGSVVSSGQAAGGRVVPAEVAVSDFSLAVAGAVLAWQHAASGTVVVTAVANARLFHPPLPVPPGPVKPQVPVPRTRLLVVDTVTGRLAAELPTASLQWETPLNDETTCTANIIVEAATEAVFEQGARDPREALSDILTGPYRFSLVIAYGNVAVQGGPLLPTDDEDDAIVIVAGAGMERMLDRRLLLRRQPDNTEFLAGASRDVIFKDTNTANAIALIAAEAMAPYTQAPRQLPIYCTQPPPTVGTETFSYFSYDAKTAWKAIGELTGRADGPDMRLEPMLAEDDRGVYVWWDLQLGNPTFDIPPGPWGPQGPLPWTWDDSVARVSRTVDSAGMTTDNISAGTGSERDRIMCEATDDTLVGWGFPVLETLDNGGTSIETLALLQKRADAYENAHKRPTDTWTVLAPIDGDPPLGAYRRGDVARLEIRRKLLIPRGDYLRRITKLAGNTTDPSTVSVTCAWEDPLGTVLTPGPGVTY